MEKILQVGAEAVIILDRNEIIKKRLKKSYRINDIDEKIRKLRTRSEAKLLEKAKEVISVPEVKKVDEKNKQIFMEFINGEKISDSLDDFSLEKQKKVCEEIGKNIAKIHDMDIIHGDLTTSNMILNKGQKNLKVSFIDFGLGFISHKIEDKATDLYLIQEALEAKHFKNWRVLFDETMKGYKNSKNSAKVIEQLKKIEKRRRYKEQY